MKSIITTITCLLLAIHGYSQVAQIRYYNLVNYGEYQKLTRNYTKAYQLYKRAFEIDAHKHAKDYMAAASIGLRLGDTDTALYYLQKAAQFPIGFNEYIISTDTSFYRTLMSHATWRQQLCSLLLENNRIRAAFEADPLYKERIRTIDILVDSDQYYNHIRGEYLKLAEDNPLRIFAEAADSMFYERYYTYILENGYPGFWVTNTDILQGLNVHICAGEQGRRFKKLFISECEKGNMLIMEFVSFLDRNEYLVRNECGLGLYTASLCNPEKDWEQLVKNRLKYGMSPFVREPRRVFNQQMILNKIVNYVDFKKVDEWY